MRKLILDRIEEISVIEQGFTKSLMKWRDYTVENVHISEVGFNNLTDTQLLWHFERLIRQMNKSY